jgi:hypothetical protein
VNRAEAKRGHSASRDRAAKGGLFHVENETAHLRPSEQQVRSRRAAWGAVERDGLADVVWARLERTVGNREQMSVEGERSAGGAESHKQIEIA